MRERKSERERREGKKKRIYSEAVEREGGGRERKTEKERRI